MASDPVAVTKLFEQLPLEAVQQVSDSYLAWYVDRVTRQLDETVAGLRAELRENDAKEANYRPSPNELGAIERLQRSGVSGMDLLDRMVEQGEDWLMLTMRRLDHFERTGLAPKDYSTWCEHALSGAYDWIDHDRLSSGAPSASAAQNGPRPGAQPAAANSAAGDRGSRNNGSHAAPATAPAGQQRWSDSGYYGPNGNGGANGNGAPPDEDDRSTGQRNIFRIFSN